MPADKGAEDHDAAADDGEVGFDHDQRGGGRDFPRGIRFVEEDGDEVGADYRDDAGPGVFRGQNLVYGTSSGR